MAADEYFLQRAIAKAREGIRKGQTPFGACIAKGDKIVCSAHNTVWKDVDSTAHAEVNAIRKACKKLKTIDLSGCVIYSTCEPCPMCFSAIHWAKIDKIVYGARIADARCAGFREMPLSNNTMKKLGKSGVKIAGGIMAKENKALFAQWSKSKGRRAY
ncbi:MAG: nucleoside deaminase [Candidatus Altiarchaeota archaeon]|nr:nucleoside deaminase [Candidatus Altiarchaeota archaeon]